MAWNVTGQICGEPKAKTVISLITDNQKEDNKFDNLSVKSMTEIKVYTSNS